MNRKIIVMGVMTLLATTTAPVFAETGKDAMRIEKLEERAASLEARVAKVEASTHKQMGMMEHEHGKQGMGGSPMGQAPQQNPGMGGAMPPQAAAPQQPGSAMPPMGDM